ncbi:MAG: arginine--tRNA ligase, partial [Pseudomonadota bacterium]
MSITAMLSALVGDAFTARGLEAKYGAVRTADRPDLAQFQCNGALAAAKATKQNPRDLAGQIAEELSANEETFSSVSVAGPGFLNLTLNDAFLAREINHLSEDDRLGGWSRPEPAKLIIDYGGPNVAKPLHVGHLRSAIIGEALKRLCRFVGDDVVGDIHLGDWGLQMGQLITEYQRRFPDAPYFDPNASEPFPAPEITLDDLEAMYPAAAAACKEDPARADEARKATKALQDGSPGYRALWRGFVDLSIAAMRENYDDLGVTFDLWKGEADADPYISEIVSDFEARALSELSDGAVIVRV